jgi:DNA polymerase III subunit beta
MKLTITREQLQEGLVAVAASVPAKTTLPILSNILLEATRDGIRLSGTDLDISVSTTVSASVDQEGAITLPARKLVEIVRELPSAAIRLTASGEQRVAIECGRSRFRLLGLPREEFPAFPGVKFEGGMAGGLAGSPEAHLARRLCGEHRREPPDPERRPLGA